eukprot:3901256-Alexandrium_andersonii.AAC.1
MSASLVGSEMCIRDRLPAIQAIQPRTESRDPGPPIALRSPLLTRATPVSYTHLTLPTICSV